MFWGLAIGFVALSLAVAYKIVKSDGQVDFQGGVDGIQVKISKAQKTIADAQQELTDAQKQLDEREAALKKREQAATEREAKVQELLASIDKTAAAPPTLTPQQAQVELKKLRASPPVALVAPEPVAVRARLEKLDALRSTLSKRTPNSWTPREQPPRPSKRRAAPGRAIPV